MRATKPRVREAIGARCREARERIGISKREAGRRANLALYFRVENGVTADPRTSTLFAIARALEVDPTWLATGEGSPDGQRRTGS